MFRFFIIALLSVSFMSGAQQNSIKGKVYSDKGEPLPFSTVALMNIADSTLEFFGITNKQGDFRINGIRKDSYLMQVSYMGYETQYHKVQVPLSGDDNFGGLVLKESSLSIEEVEVFGEAVPLRIKQDTIEYNSAAFKTKPDAVAEDLLKKLPGISVDRAGNIKAMGEDVSQVLVDGKEFFSSDHKVATRNLPAKAVDKVQMFDKKSEQSEFTGIDDGSRAKALNLVLDEDAKAGVFGSLMVGGSLNGYYQSSAKMYRFTDHYHLAALGMVNNINHYGFSFSDYMQFGGGFSSLSSHGGSIDLSGSNSIPVNFGEEIKGLTESGAGGLNLSRSNGKYNRVYLSYLVNGSDRDLISSQKTWNYLDDKDYQRNTNRNENRKSLSNGITFGLKQRIDSSSNLKLNGNVSFVNGSTSEDMILETLEDELQVSNLDSKVTERTDQLNASMGANYIYKLIKDKTVVELDGQLNLSSSVSNDNFRNVFRLATPASEFFSRQYRDFKTERQSYRLGIDLTQRLGEHLFMTPGIRISHQQSQEDRGQGLDENPAVPIDSLSTSISSYYLPVVAGLGFRYLSGKLKTGVSLDVETGKHQVEFLSDEKMNNSYQYFTPGFNFEYLFSKSKRLTFRYYSGINVPSVRQLNPAVNNLNPGFLIYGNRNLQPEYYHNARLNFFLFDHFSFTSVNAGINGGYTAEKINDSRNIDENYNQRLTLVNVEQDFRLNGRVSFTTPIRKLGMKVNLHYRESYNKGINIINNTENDLIVRGHTMSLSLENRKKKVWDIISGMELNLSKSQYSIEENLNNTFTDVSWFGEINCEPGEKLNFGISADIVKYKSAAIYGSELVPLLNAEISYHFLKNNRLKLGFNAFDLLNKNTSVERISEANYLGEIRTNNIGRYFMFSLSWRLNKFGSGMPGLSIDMKRR